MMENSAFPITVALHQGSTLTFYLCVLVMDEPTKHVQDEVPWCMIFIERIVLIDETRKRWV